MVIEPVEQRRRFVRRENGDLILPGDELGFDLNRGNFFRYRAAAAATARGAAATAATGIPHRPRRGECSQPFEQRAVDDANIVGAEYDGDRENDGKVTGFTA